MAPVVKRTSLGAAMAPLYKTAIAMITTLHTRFAASLFSRVTSARDADALANSAVNQSEQFSIRTNHRPIDNAAAANDHDDVSEDAPFVYQMVRFQVRDHMSREAFPSLVDHLKAKPGNCFS